jgi:hypothetical protein
MDRKVSAQFQGMLFCSRLGSGLPLGTDRDRMDHYWGGGLHGRE